MFGNIAKNEHTELQREGVNIKSKESKQTKMLNDLE
jgi:hypothetical protein